MKFHVNADCIGCGLCVSTCPEVFTMTDGGTAAAAPHRRKTSIDNAAQVWYNNSH